jgi:hypothetical protein
LSPPSTGVDGGTDSTCVCVEHTEVLIVLVNWTD